MSKKQIKKIIFMGVGCAFIAYCWYNLLPIIQ